MKAVEKLLEDVKKGKRPTAAENSAVKRVAVEFVAKLDRALKASKARAKSVVGGSGAKGTWLRGMHDIDVFVCFDYEMYKKKSGELSEFLAKAMKKAFPKHERLHGSRDYFRVRYGNYSFELVPILKIKKAAQAMNITDASLLHSDWVNRQLQKPKSLMRLGPIAERRFGNRKAGLDDEIRLAKAFSIAQRVYGAESYVRGFSGYACEILTIYYSSFLKLMTAAATKWKKSIAAGKKVVIDAGNHYRRKDPLRELNEAKVQSELVVIDPVQPDRNATAALGNETLQRFISAAAGFIKNQSGEFFEKEEVTVEKLRQKAKGKRLVVVEAVPIRGKEDVAGAKLVKAYQHILQQLEKNGFELAMSGWEWDKHKPSIALMWYATEKGEKGEPKAEIREGPPLSNTQHAEKFRDEHSTKAGRELFEKRGRLYARIARKYKQPQQLISALAAGDAYLKDKAQHYAVKSFE
ncbi:nucleotidyltransferase domain-containing protein [Candidatus Woesearchaeota archaeon]|nr:nucleotidyltransferase domain-containing protein [Candidatus Woesearchaeota archaeon]